MLCLVLIMTIVFAGMAVAYSAPTRHGCLKVVENNFCASRRGMISSVSMFFPLRRSQILVDLILMLEHFIGPN